MIIYQNNIEKYQAVILGLAKVLKRSSTIRLVAFLLSISIIIFLVNERLITWLFIIVPLFILFFGFLIKHYNRIKYQKRHTTFLKEVNEEEVIKLESKLSGFPTGQTFIKGDHPYVSDLDIFGPHSLFQLINRTTTESGNLCLVEWLSGSASNDVILERQQAVKELAPKLDWRQHFQALGMHFKNSKSDYSKLLAWAEKPEQLLPNQLKYWLISIILSVLSTSAAVYYFVRAFPFDVFIYAIPLILILFVNYLILRRVKPIAEEIIDNTHQNIKILAGYQSLIYKIESEKFDSKILRALQSIFSQNNQSAGREINKLKKILEVFQLRGSRRSDSNKFYFIFNVFWLLDVYWIILTEKWKYRNKLSLKAWALAVSEFEVLNSLAGFYYSNPSFTFPEIKDETFSIHFDMLGHPLISQEKRVCNDFSLNGRGEIAMITGSNMAGKSTFLRTVGVNLVLALMGAPCCAKSGQVSNMKIFTSMRTQDNLEEGVSSFYAELKRVEELLKLIQNGQAIFFLLDEMFKGTNSEDRYKGGVSLIKQLSQLNSFGIVSTHDLELAKLSENNMIVSNYSFNSEIQINEMTFNYKLTEGICKDFNASELMKRSGINILPNVAKM